jgi:hypothetical protein
MEDRKKKGIKVQKMIWVETLESYHVSVPIFCLIFV